jgi:hypothetical protein
MDLQPDSSIMGWKNIIQRRRRLRRQVNRLVRQFL